MVFAPSTGRRPWWRTVTLLAIALILFLAFKMVCCSGGGKCIFCEIIQDRSERIIYQVSE